MMVICFLAIILITLTNKGYDLTNQYNKYISGKVEISIFGQTTIIKLSILSLSYFIL